MKVEDMECKQKQAKKDDLPRFNRLVEQVRNKKDKQPRNNGDEKKHTGGKR